MVFNYKFLDNEVPGPSGKMVIMVHLLCWDSIRVWYLSLRLIQSPMKAETKHEHFQAKTRSGAEAVLIDNVELLQQPCTG